MDDSTRAALNPITDTTPDPHACINLQSDALRLACYDKTFGHPAPPTTTVQTRPSMDHGHLRAHVQFLTATARV